MKSEYLKLKSEGFSERFLKTLAGSHTKLRLEIIKNQHLKRECPNCKLYWVKVSELPIPIPNKNHNDLRDNETSTQKSGFCSWDCKEEYSSLNNEDSNGIESYRILINAGFSRIFLDNYPGNDKDFRKSFIKYLWAWEVCRKCKDKFVNFKKLEVANKRPFTMHISSFHLAGFCSWDCSKDFYGCEGEDLRLRINGFILASNPDFYDSDEWRKIRYQALKAYENKCQCCGITPNQGGILHVDHIKPRRFYPDLALDIRNLQILCKDCNLGKGAWDDTDWRDGGVSNA